MEQGSKKEGKEMEFQSPDLPIPCTSNCGFFGNSATSNLCSKCYREMLLSKSKGLIVKTEDKARSSGGGGDGAVKAEEVVETLGARLANRCSFCNKRVGLTGFKCRCEYVFCSLHRYSDKHNCLFDYKGAGHDAIAKANPIVKADKVDKI